MSNATIAVAALTVVNLTVAAAPPRPSPGTTAPHLKLERLARIDVRRGAEIVPFDSTTDTLYISGGPTASWL